MSPRPTVSATSERIYGRLPDYLRAADEQEPSGGGWPLLRFLSAVGDQLGELEALLDRIAFVPPEDGGDPDDSSDLVDPFRADDAWLRWLAQLFGIETGPIGGVGTGLPYGTLSLRYPSYADLEGAFTTYAHMLVETTPPAVDRSPAELRVAIANADTQSWLAGSVQSIIDVVRPLLTGSRSVAVVPNNGGPFEVAVITYASATPDPFAILPAIDRAGVKPGGVHLTHIVATEAPYWVLNHGWASYADLEGAFTTYAAMTAYVPPGG